MGAGGSSTPRQDDYRDGGVGASTEPVSPGIRTELKVNGKVVFSIEEDQPAPNSSNSNIQQQQPRGTPSSGSRSRTASPHTPAAGSPAFHDRRPNPVKTLSTSSDSSLSPSTLSGSPRKTALLSGRARRLSGPAVMGGTPVASGPSPGSPGWRRGSTGSPLAHRDRGNTGTPSSPGVNGPSTPVTPIQKILAAIDQCAPFPTVITDEAITVSWASVSTEADELRLIQEYQLQWRMADPGSRAQSGLTNSVMGAEQLVVRCTRDWSALPESSIRRFERTACIEGLPPSCRPMEFRVRARNYAGWGAFSGPSEGFATHPGVHQPPAVCNMLTFFGVELRWPQLVHWDYGRKIHYALLVAPDTASGGSMGAQTQPPDDMRKEKRFDVGATCKYHLGGEGCEPLWPLTRYSCVVIASYGLAAEGGEDPRIYKSPPEFFTTLTAPPPEPPEAPTLAASTSSTLSLEWEPARMAHPAAQRFPPKEYFLYGKESGPAHRFVLLYRGVERTYTLGSRQAPRQRGRPGRRDEERKDDAEPFRVEPNTQYSLRLTAANDFGRSDFSRIVTYQTRPEGEDGEPQNSPGVNTTRADDSSVASGGGGSAAASPTTANSTDEVVSAPSSPSRKQTHEVMLQNGWLECWYFDEQQGGVCAYYYEPTTGKTQWEHPDGALQGPEGKEFAFRKKRFELLLKMWQAADDDVSYGADGQDVTTLRIERNDLVHDSFTAFRRAEPADLRRPLRIEFVGEDGIDSGGLTKDWAESLTRLIFDGHYALFHRKDSSNVYMLNRHSSINESHLHYLHFLGQFLGKAIFDKRVVDVPFCRAIYLHMLGQEVGLEVLREIDPVKHKSLQWMATNSIDGVIYDNFEIVSEHFGEKQTLELVPGGSSIEVTDANKMEYIQAVVQWELTTSVEKQIESFVRGFYEFVPKAALAPFSVEDLEHLLNGDPEVDVERLRRHCTYAGGFKEAREGSPTVKLFWQVMRERFQNRERGMVLRFVTGSSKEPLDGFKPPFQMVLASGEVDDGGADSSDKLPTSHTCFNQLVLPRCATAGDLVDKLMYAMTHSGGAFYLT